MTLLEKIMAQKEREVAAKLHVADKYRAEALMRNTYRGFASALNRGSRQLGIIAEIKKASPSAGVIDAHFDPMAQATMYAQGRASALSVLTDEKFFQGSLPILNQVAKHSHLPILRKDFICHPLQIYEAIIAGADAILLIVAALDAMRLQELYTEAHDLGLDVLVEVHNLEEMDRALSLQPRLVGINNRNLATFVTDLSVTEQLAEEVPDEVLLVSESGIASAEDCLRVLQAGANAVLVGESLMRAEHPAALLDQWLALELPEDNS